MRDEPTGRYALKIKGRPLTARTFHLYRDCGHLSPAAAIEESEIIEPSDEIVSVLEMRICSACTRRAEEVSAEDVIADALRHGEGSMMIDSTPEGAANDVIEALDKAGYHIRRYRRGGTA